MVAGEASADRHAAAVIRELKRILPEVEVFGMGGPAMAEAGMECLYGMEQFSVMGFSDVLPRIRQIHSVYRGLCDEVLKRRPQVVVPVDLPDFNMRLAGRLKRSGLKILYYIAPQAWAGRKYRARTLARITDGLAVIFPFEEAFFSSYGVNARYVGHPFMEEQSAGAAGGTWPPGRIALLPGSRMHEIRTILPVMIEVKRIVQKSPHITWHLPGGRIDPRFGPGRSRRGLHSSLTQVTWPWSSQGHRASDSAQKVPRSHLLPDIGLNYRLARAFVRIDHIGMPNIILGRRAVPELIQDELTPERLAREVLEIIEDRQRYDRMQQSFDEMRRMLGNASPSKGVATWIADMAG